MPHCPDFAAGISCVEVVHDIFQNDQHLIVFVNGVHTVIESDEPDRKSPADKHILEIDPVTAPVVLRIFDMRLQGDSFRKIARSLPRRLRSLHKIRLIFPALASAII